MGTMGALPFSCAVRKLRMQLMNEVLSRIKEIVPIVITILSNIPDPRQSLITTLLNYLEVTNLDTRNSEVGYLKFHGNGRPLIHVLV